MARFAYYKNLKASDKKIYDQSDAIPSLRLPWAEKFPPFINALTNALESEDQRETQKFTQKLMNALTQVFQVSEVRVKVLAKRPSAHWGELHGLYENAHDGTKPVITVWMRTAKRKQVVAFKTYLRTVLHELLHHLDYTLLKLKDSFHTEGFYKRESSLIKQILPQESKSVKK